MNTISELAINEDKSPFGQLQLQSPEAIDLKMDIAGIGARSHAFIIDWHIRVLLAIAWLLALGIAFFSLKGLSQYVWKDASSTVLYIWLIPAAAIYFLYHPILEIVMSGRTPGKRMAGVRLVTLNGLTPGSSALLLRNIFRLLDCLPGFYILGLATVALTRNQVRIGDIAAGLVMVYDSEVSQKELKQISTLAINSHLSQNDQALLLDLLKRWKQLQIDMRIRLGEQFLNKIGVKPANNNGKTVTHSKEILKQLEQLIHVDKNP